MRVVANTTGYNGTSHILHGYVGCPYRRGNCHDNAVAESFFNLLKRERIRRKVYRTSAKAQQDVFDYIEMFYNSTWKHAPNGMLSPVEFERQHKPQSEGVWKTLGASVWQLIGLNTATVRSDVSSHEIDLDAIDAANKAGARANAELATQRVQEKKQPVEGKRSFLLKGRWPKAYQPLAIAWLGVFGFKGFANRKSC